MRGVKQLGFRVGNWLSADECSSVLKHAYGTSLRARRDYAMLAMLFGCGLRRSELVGLEMNDIQVRQGHWAVVDLIGKGGHIRTVPIPDWVKAALDEWTVALESVRASYSERLPEQTRYGARASHKMSSGMPSKAAAREQGCSISSRTNCVGPARSCAIPAVVRSSRFNSCWAMHQCRPPSAIWDASRTSGIR